MVTAIENARAAFPIENRTRRVPCGWACANVADDDMESRGRRIKIEPERLENLKCSGSFDDFGFGQARAHGRYLHFLARQNRA